MRSRYHAIVPMGSEFSTGPRTEGMTRMSNLPAPTRALNKSELARQHGVSRTTIRRRMAAGWTPTVVEVLPPEPAVATPVHPLSRGGHQWTSGILVLTGLGIGALAIGINLQQGLHLGATPAASWTLASMAVATDLLALTLPVAAAALWHARRPVFASMAWTVWTAAAILATLASLGFVERNLGDVAAGRQAMVTTTAATVDQRTAAIDAARMAADAARKAREGECAKRGSFCREREADERAANSALASAIAVPIPAAATVSSADPQVTAAVRLSNWAGAPVTPDSVVNLRLALMVAIPNLAGLVLAFGIALRRR
jgi:hypothetical protein